ncbi:MAG: L,D-transpeptidase family protein [Candidatus Paceibacterota bacterium]
MKSSLITKIVLLVVAMAATFTLLTAQWEHTESITIKESSTSSRVVLESDIENIMPEEQLADIRRDQAQQEEEEAQLTSSDTETETSPEESEDDEEETQLPTYIEVTDACGPYYEGDCLNVRAAPSTAAEIQDKLRNGQVLKVEDRVQAEGLVWYKVVFDEWLRHPERLNGDWYVAAEYVRAVDPNTLTESASSTSSPKRIVINLSEQKLYAYEGDDIYMEEEVSTGVIGALTPRGTFTVFYRTPSRYMQGPIPGITDDDYDLPGVPWNLYFTEQGAVIHGAYWHDKFGRNWSHGCVNLPPEKAMQLYAWTPEGTEVVVRD